MHLKQAQCAKARLCGVENDGGVY